MIDQASVVQTLQTLARQIGASDSGAALRLTMLSDAIEHGTNAEAWAYSDINTLIGPDSIVERYRKQQEVLSRKSFISHLEIIRNTFIFLPIIVTWFGISQATEAYNTLVSAAIRNKEVDIYSQPFIYLWQQRFGGLLPPYLTLSNVALFDVVILLIIVVLTFLTLSLAEKIAAEKELDAQRLRANLVQAITGATLYLHARPKLTSADNLEVVARQIDNLGRQLVNQLGTIARETATHLEGMAQGTSARFETMSQAIMQQFAQTTQQAMQQLGGISNEMKKQLQEGGDYLLKLGTLTSGVVQLSNDIQSAAVALKTTNATLTDSVTNLIKPVKELASQQNNLLNAVQQSVSSLQGISDAFSNLATQQQRMGHDVESAVDDMKLAVEAFTKLAGEQNKLSGQYSTFLQHLQFEHDKQAQLATLNAWRSSNDGSLWYYQ